MYIKTQCLQTKREAALLLGRKEKALRVKVKRVALIKSLINARVEDALGGLRNERSIKVDQICKLKHILLYFQNSQLLCFHPF